MVRKLLAHLRHHVGESMITQGARITVRKIELEMEKHPPFSIERRNLQEAKNKILDGINLVERYTHRREHEVRNS